MKTGVAFSLLVFATVSVPAISRAQWVFDGNPLCTAANSQIYPTIVSDGAGGAIVVWQDSRNGDNDIYVQRVSPLGTVQWSANGVAVCTSPNEQTLPQIVADGAGGAIMTWEDARNDVYDIYAQRINAAGAVQWGANGVALCAALGPQFAPTIVTDGAGGAIVTWVDRRSLVLTDIFAQRINAAGTVQWVANGVALCTATGAQENPAIVSDGVGGAIVAWQDVRGLDFDIYGQRVNASGTVQWAANGVALGAAGYNQINCAIASDGAAGAIVTWQDNRSGSGSDIFAQWVNASGAVQWAADGVFVCYATHQEFNPTIVSDGAGGAIVAWEDNRSWPTDVYAQHVTSFGGMQWAANGVALCDGDVHNLSIAPDGANGAIVTWWDGRSGVNYDVYAQRVMATGAVPWASNGVVLGSAAWDQAFPTIAPDGAGGAIRYVAR